MSETFQSTDSIRSAKPLRYAQSMSFEAPLELSRGDVLSEVTVAYETYGELNRDKSNAVLIGHAISGDSHVARHDPDDDSGWWEDMVGPGKPIDTDHYFVICSNVLGGCRGTTGPGSINPKTGKRYGQDFPFITVQDMVDLQKRLIDGLGIQQLCAVIGGSLGGHQAMVWATRYPKMVKTCVAIATSPRLSSQSLAFDVVGRNAILSDPDYHNGQYYDQDTKPDTGLAIARMLGHITYLSPESMNAKFEVDRHNPRNVPTEFEKRFSVGSYLAHQGDKFVERFDANSYIAISLAMDMFDLGSDTQQLTQTLGQSSCEWLLVSFSSDWLFPPDQSRTIVDALIRAGRPVTYCEIPTPAGHDAFLLNDEVNRFGKLIRAKLDGPQPGKIDYPASSGRTSIFTSERLDYQQILACIPEGASVMDLGCGRGGLLAQVKERDAPHHGTLVGMDVSETKIIKAVEHGFNVIDHDLNIGLPSFADKSFDVVVLSQTLQAVKDVTRVLDEMLRVGKRAIVSFPNFAYAPLRKMLAEEGKSPRAAGWFDYSWYDTPNRRFPSILDFDEYCAARDIHVEQTVFLDLTHDKRVDENPNLNADTAVYVISR